jgi:hypothetical protein
MSPCKLVYIYWFINVHSVNIPEDLVFINTAVRALFLTKVSFLLTFEQVTSTENQNINRGVADLTQPYMNNKNSHCHGEPIVDCFMCVEVCNCAALCQCKNLLKLQQYLVL